VITVCYCYRIQINGSRPADPEQSEFEQWSHNVAPQPRHGWSTPTYEDILNKKRTEEKYYRLVFKKMLGDLFLHFCTSFVCI